MGSKIVAEVPCLFPVDGRDMDGDTREGIRARVETTYMMMKCRDGEYPKGCLLWSSEWGGVWRRARKRKRATYLGFWDP